MNHSDADMACPVPFVMYIYRARARASSQVCQWKSSCWLILELAGVPLQDAVGLLACGEGWDLILHAEMSYFSLTSNTVLRASFLRVMGSILSPAVLGPGKHSCPSCNNWQGRAPARGSHCLVCCYLCFRLSAVVTEVTITGSGYCGIGSDCFLWVGRLECISRWSHI